MIKPLQTHPWKNDPVYKTGRRWNKETRRDRAEKLGVSQQHLEYIENDGRLRIQKAKRRRNGKSEQSREAKLREQNYRCPLCLKLLEIDIKNSTADDHCHLTGKDRGILCKTCNTAIHAADRDLGWLERTKRYLMHYKLLHSRN